MKVSEVMEKSVESVDVKTSILEVARLIFGRKINGVPVCKGKKVMGFITERDIIDQFYPSIQDYVEDYAHASDFEAMEEKVGELFTLPAEKIMNRAVTTVTADTPVLKAQSLMKVRKVGRLPVVDAKGNLIGILSKGDIFRAIVGDKLPFEEEETFHDWFSKHYNLIVDWDRRLKREIPDLTRLFKKEKVKNVLDVGCGIGMHDVELAKEGFDVVGIDRSPLMIEKANQMLKKLSQKVRNRIKFVNCEYKDLEKVLDQKFEAAIFMGSAIAHYKDPEQIIKEVTKVLVEKPIMIFQISNFDKVLNVYRRIFDFNIRRSPVATDREHLFLRFYDPVKNGYLTYNVVVFDNNGKKWIFRGVHSTPITPLDKSKMATLLKKAKFIKVTFYGGEGGFYYDDLFSKPFNPLRSDYMNIIAKR